MFYELSPVIFNLIFKLKLKVLLKLWVSIKNFTNFKYIVVYFKGNINIETRVLENPWLIQKKTNKNMNDIVSFPVRRGFWATIRNRYARKELILSYLIYLRHLIRSTAATNWSFFSLETRYFLHACVSSFELPSNKEVWGWRVSSHDKCEFLGFSPRLPAPRKSNTADQRARIRVCLQLR